MAFAFQKCISYCTNWLLFQNLLWIFSSKPDWPSADTFWLVEGWHTLLELQRYHSAHWTNSLIAFVAWDAVKSSLTNSKKITFRIVFISTKLCQIPVDDHSFFKWSISISISPDGPIFPKTEFLITGFTWAVVMVHVQLHTTNVASGLTSTSSMY